MVKVELIYYTRDGERLVALASRHAMLTSSIRDDEVEKWILESYRRQNWKPWRLSWYVFEITGCSKKCISGLIEYGVPVILQQDTGREVVKAFTRRIAKYVSMQCREEDYMCYALALEKFTERLEREPNIIKQAEILEAVEEMFEVPLSVKTDREVHIEYTRHILYLLKLYLVLLNKGLSFGDAEHILPLAMKSNLIVTMNAGDLISSFLPSCMCARTPREIREVAWNMWVKLTRVHPRLFKYAGPKCILLENTLRDKPVPLEDFIDGKEKIKAIPRCPERVPGKNIPDCVRNTHDIVYNISY